MLGLHQNPETRKESFETWFKARKKTYGAGQQQISSQYEREQKDAVLAEFHVKAKPYFFQRSKEDHLRDKFLHKVARYDVWTIPSKAQKEAAASFMKSSDLVENANDNQFSALPAIAKLRQISFHHYFGSTGREEEEEENGNGLSAYLEAYLQKTSVSQIRADSPKLALCADMVRNFVSNNHKVLIFSEFKRPFYFLERLLESKQIGSYRMHGDEPPSHRDDHVRDFQSQNSKHKVMLLTYGAAGVGITLNAADRIIFLSPHWNPAVEEQAEGRMDRIGQTNECISIRLFNAGSIEQSIHGYQAQKEANTLEALVSRCKGYACLFVCLFRMMMLTKDVFA